MKKVFVLLMTLFLIFSCSSEEEVKENTIPYLSEILKLCKSECLTNSESYCLDKKTFTNKENEITGTCRSFGKYNIGFPKCEGFCKQYGKNRDLCVNKDGSVNEKCN